MKHRTITCLLLCTLGAMLTIGCAGMTIYDQAKVGIAYSPLGYAAADAIVDRYCKRHPDKAGEVTATYTKIKVAVKKGLDTLAQGIKVAEDAGTKVDQVKLHADIAALVAKVLDFALSLEDAIAGPAAGLHEDSTDTSYQAAVRAYIREELQFKFTAYTVATAYIPRWVL